MKLRGYMKSSVLASALLSRRNVPLDWRTAGRSVPLEPPWMYTSPFSSIVEPEYQRARFMLLPRASTLLDRVNRLLLLLPVLVVLVPVQLSPPARNTWLPPGSTTCEPQKMSVLVTLSSVRWPPLRPELMSQMS